MSGGKHAGADQSDNMTEHRVRVMGIQERVLSMNQHRLTLCLCCSRMQRSAHTTMIPSGKTAWAGKGGVEGLKEKNMLD